jgi:RNA polymerase sigma factor (sigma-70 family)
MDISASQDEITNLKIDRRYKDRSKIPCVHSFEDISGILYNQAYKLCKKYGDRFEADELVNEAWLIGDVQRQENIKYVGNRAYWDMMEYIRRETKGRITKYREQKGEKGVHKEITNIDVEDKLSYFEQIECDSIKRSDQRCEDLDFLGHVMSNIRRSGSHFLMMYYFDHLTLKELGKRYGIEETSACNKKKKIIEDIQSELRESENFTISKKKGSNHRLYDIIPEYVSDYEIDNDCSLYDDEFVLE